MTPASPAGCRILFVVPALFSLPFLLPSVLGAQEEVIPVIRGEVREGDRPLPQATVVLHQVSNELSGEIDSIRARDDGTFQLRLPRVPAHGVRSEVYFASVRHRGLLYFGPAITNPAQLDSLYLIQAYDTASVPVGGAVLPVEVRNVFLTKTEGGWEVADFFQLRQEGDRTLFSPDEGVTWQYPLPPSARDFEVGQGDLGADAVRFEDGSLAVYTPLPPGDRLFLVRYRIMGEELTIPLPGRTERIEVLVRTPGPRTEFPPLAPIAPVELEPGAVFERYAGEELVAAEVRGRILADPFRLRAEWLAIALAGLLGGAGVFSYRRHHLSDGSGKEPGKGLEREAVLLEIAELDEAFLRKADPSGQTRAEYSARREALLKRLVRLS